jgi:hypothetical protein
MVELVMVDPCSGGRQTRGRRCRPVEAENMTTRKHFKRLVRERMQKTGERYSVARAHVAASAPADGGWDLRGGVHADTAAIANVLANLGVVAPHTGAPLSEALILGVGGGLGAGYILWEFAEHAERILVLGFRNQWQYPGRWASATAERLGLHADVHETGGAKAAGARLDEVLDRGLPAIVWADAHRLGHRHLPEHLDAKGGPPVVIYGRDGDRLLLDDRSTGHVSIAADRVADARARVGSYKHRLIAVDPELVEIDADRLAAAALAGMEQQVAHLRQRSDSFSLPAWRKWARMMTSRRDPKAWPRVFADGRGLAGALATIYTEAGRGGNLRGIYAEFLDEAAPLTARPGASDAAAAWRRAAAAWDRVIDVALPPGEPELGRLREHIDAADAAIAEGDAGRTRAEGAAAARWALQRELDARLPDHEQTVDARLAALAAAVEEVYAAEREAVAGLEATLSG